jgi:ABC-type multidrug transport system ATPase subunit
MKDSTISSSYRFGNGVTDDSFTITWKDLTYTLPRTFWDKRNPFNQERHDTPKVILHNISGHIRSREVLGLMGASGSGKSVLIQCLVGVRKQGLTGEITVSANRKKPSMSLIPQHETLIPQLTVRELLTFSLKIHKKDGIDGNVIEETLSSLGLQSCCNNLSSHCSGGQQKRVSIALELLKDPDVLIFDESTSGLDSAACVDVIELLKKIALDKNVAVMMSIHQPVYPAFVSMNRIYCLTEGRTFYDGAPRDISDYLMLELSVNHVKEDNPADVMMEASCSCFGDAAVVQSVKYQESLAKQVYSNLGSQYPLHDPRDNSFFSLIRIKPRRLVLLIMRNLLIGIRDPLILLMRLFATIFSVALVVLVFEDSGRADPCPPNITALKESLSNIDRNDPNINDTSIISALIMTQVNQEMQLTNNVTCLLFILLMAFMSAVAANVLMIPKSYLNDKKEVLNKWYSLNEFMVAMTVSDAFFCFLFNLGLLLLPFLYWSHQYTSCSMVISLCLFHALFGLTAQSMGHCLVGATVTQPATGIFLLVVAIIPLLVISGSFVPLSTLDPFLQYVSYMNVFRWALQSTLGIMYGNERCGDEESMWSNMNETRRVIHDTVNDIQYSATRGWLFLDRSVAGDYEGGRFLINKLEDIFINRYFSREGRISSLVMVLYDLKDGDAFKANLFLVIHFFFYKTLSYLIFYRNISK